MLSYWKILPDNIRNPLLESSTGKLHLMEQADNALSLAANARSSHEAERLIRLAFDVLLSAWESDLLDGQVAGHLAALAQGRAWVPDALVKAAVSISKSWVKPENLGYYQRLLERDDLDRLWRYLETQMVKEPGNYFWVQQGLNQALLLADQERVEYFLGAGILSGAPGLRPRLLGEFKLMCGEYKEAVHALQQSSILPLPGSVYLCAEALLRMGARDGALRMYLDCLKQRPWQVNLLLKAHDLAFGVDKDLDALEGGAVVLIYSYNKAQELDSTLGALFNSRLNDCRVLALDNGSRDHTAQVLAAWKDRAGERLGLVRLPVNVGAPAARNWLMRHQSTEQYRYVAFLDDDALVPEDWLLRLGAAVKRYPQAGVWGCRVVDAQQPVVLQSVDLHLRDASAEYAGGDNDEPLVRRFYVSNYHLQVQDQGQFAYLRPCASVTGCCHLFERSRLLQVGDFDLWFSPSQLDDLDRDIRMLAQGHPAVYQGHLTVRHLKRSGKGVSRSSREWGNAQGNEIKLQLKYSPEEIARVRQLVHEWLWSDMQAKLLALQKFSAENS